MGEVVPLQPKLYNPYHDAKDISKLLDNYKSYHEEKAQLQSQVEQVQDIDALYGTIVKHLGQHTQKDKDGKVTSERHGYHDHSDKKRWIEDLVGNLALHGVKKMYGDDASKLYSKKENHELIRQYVQQHMLAGTKMSYEEFIEQLGEEKNLRAAFHDSDSMLRKVLDTYTQIINGNNRKLSELREHLSKPEHHQKVSEYGNKLIADQKYQFKSHIAGSTLLDLIADIIKNPHIKVTGFKNHKKIFDPVKDKDLKKAA